MAVIQDLPPEILHRILELGAADPECFHRRDLCSTAVVARAWTQSSQELLIFEWWSPESKRAPQYDTAPPPSRRIRSLLILLSLTAAVKARRLVERHGTLLCGLEFYQGISASDLAFFLVNDTFTCRLALSFSSLTSQLADLGLSRLSLTTTVQGNFPIPDGTKIAFETLDLYGSSLPSASALQTLVDTAPGLTRLTLSYAKNLLTYRAPLLALAPRLRHVTISKPLCDFGGHPSGFLHACTSLIRLDLHGLAPGDLTAVLPCVPLHVTHLQSSFAPKLCTQGSIRADLWNAFKQPLLAKLKQWRWIHRRIFMGMTFVLPSEEFVEGWEMACRAHGIEPRGEERYYTD